MPFDIEKFKQAQVTAAFDDHFTPAPAGEYGARIASWDVTQSQGKKDPSKTYTFLKVEWGLEDPTGSIEAVTGQDESRAYQDISLDMTDDGKNLLAGTGKNIGLGALRTALGQNDPKKAWAPSMLDGAKARVKVEQEKFQRRDGGDGLKAVVASVTAYAAASGAGRAAPSAMPSRPGAAAR